MLFTVLTGIAALTAVALGVAGIRQWAENRRILDVPNDRSSHTTPTPRGGGLMIAVVTLGGLLPLLRAPDAESAPLLSFLFGATLIAAVSWIDDLRSLSSRVRIVVHLAAALLLLLGGPLLAPFASTAIPGLVSLAVAGIWIVGLTNAYNFMDGIDGIAGTQAVIGGLTWCVLGHRLDSTVVTALGLLLAATSMGFLIHNWPPARIFMGDVGSAFLGYAFAALPILSPRTLHPLTAALVVWPFLFDTTFTLSRRLRRGENVFHAHRSHLYQRLVIAGFSHKQVTSLYGVLSLSGGVLAVWTQLTQRAFPSFVVVGIFAVSLWGLVVWSENQRRRITQ